MPFYFYVILLLSGLPLRGGCHQLPHSISLWECIAHVEDRPLNTGVFSVRKSRSG